MSWIHEDEIMRLRLLSATHPNARILTQLADAYRKAGDLEQARDAVERALDRHPEYAPGYVTLGRVLGEQGDAEGAERAFRRALELEPGNRIAEAGLRRLVAGGDAANLGPFEDDDRLEDVRFYTTLASRAPDLTRMAAAALEGIQPAANLPPERPIGTYFDAILSFKPANPPRMIATPAARANASVAPISLAKRSVAAPFGGSDASTSSAAGGADAVALADLLVGLIEYRDPFYRGGSSLARLIAVAIGREMGLEGPALQELGLAALLRDLGRLAMGGRLIERPSVELKPDARRRIEAHVDLALQLLDGITLPDGVRAAIRHHHERWDGMGYPDGLRGEAIPLPARILAVADSLAAMISPRPYRPPRRLAAAVAEIEAEAGSNYDPAVVHALLRILPGRLRRRSLDFGLRQHIVVVDADRGRALATAIRLCSHGYLAEAATDPNDARERMRRNPVDLVAISAELPGDAAAAFLDALRDDEATATLPIVILHADGAEQRIDMLRRGADACFAGDVAFDEVLAAIGATLKRAAGAEAPTPAAATSAAETGKRTRAPVWHTLQGDLQEFPLSWLLQVLNYDSRTAAIVVRCGGETGTIYVEGGTATHAEAGELAGDAALQAMLRWSEGSFSVQPNARAAIRTVERSIMHLLLDTAVETDHDNTASIFGAVRPDG